MRLFCPNARLCCDTRNNFVSQSGSLFQIYFFVVGNSPLTCFTFSQRDWQDSVVSEIYLFRVACVLRPPLISCTCVRAC